MVITSVEFGGIAASEGLRFKVVGGQSEYVMILICTMKMRTETMASRMMKELNCRLRFPPTNPTTSASAATTPSPTTAATTTTTTTTPRSCRYRYRSATATAPAPAIRSSTTAANTITSLVFYRLLALASCGLLPCGCMILSNQAARFPLLVTQSSISW